MLTAERKKPVAVPVAREQGVPSNGGPRKLESLTGLMTELIEGEFTGYLKINFSQGGVSRVEKFEEISKRLKK
ncbi:MAG: hypothetical protein WAV26_00945 [Candidatus Deferrimicrobium sp.]